MIIPTGAGARFKGYGCWDFLGSKKSVTIPLTVVLLDREYKFIFDKIVKTFSHFLKILLMQGQD